MVGGGFAGRILSTTTLVCSRRQSTQQQLLFQLNEHSKPLGFIVATFEVIMMMDGLNLGFGFNLLELGFII